jgi:hypothetical protein
LAVELVKLRSNYIMHHEEKHRVVSEPEGRKLLEAEGIKVLGVYAVCGWMDVLHIEEKVQNSHDWDEQFFMQTAESVSRLSGEPSVKGMSRHLVLYGEKI